MLLALAWLATPASAGTVTKTFPDLEGQVRLFLDLPLGISHREFRQRVPAAWYAIALPPVEFAGDRGATSNNGWFVYRLAARGIQQPEIDLRFWKNELVFASLVYKHRLTAGIGDDQHEASVAGIEALLKERFGEPQADGRNPSQTIFRDINGSTFEFLATDDGTHQFGEVSLIVHNAENAGAAVNQHEAAGGRSSGPGIMLDCSRVDPSASLVKKIIVTIDTRALSARAAARLAERRSRSEAPPGYACNPQVVSHREIDIMLNSVKLGARLPYTYLRFKDRYGYLTSQEFQFAGPDTEDAV